jgi:hypothetical protein
MCASNYVSMLALEASGQYCRIQYLSKLCEKFWFRLHPAFDLQQYIFIHEQNHGSCCLKILVQQNTTYLQAVTMLSSLQQCGLGLLSVARSRTMWGSA